MLSRVAENVYWMARYVERAENTARILDVNEHLQLDILDDDLAESGGQWLPLISIMADEEPFFKRHKTATRETVTHFMACDPENPNSIVSCLRAARENARSIREIISSEMWLHLNTLYLTMTDFARGGPEAITTELLAEVRLGSHLFFGLLSDIMSRGEGYSFAQLGRFIERADKTSRVIDVKYFILLPHANDIGSPIDTIQWMAVLKSVSAYEMFRKRHAVVDPPSVVQFLLRDEDFPRSVHYCLRCVRLFLDQVAGSPEEADTIAAARSVDDLRRELEATAAEDIILRGVHQTIDRLQVHLNDLHGQIHGEFFSRKPTGL